VVHEGNNVREFYSALPRPVRVGIEATGSMQWFVNLMEELGIECQVGNPAVIRAAEPRKQKHDRRDAGLIMKLLLEDRLPAIWLPSKELQDLRASVQRGGLNRKYLRSTQLPHAGPAARGPHVQLFSRAIRTRIAARTASRATAPGLQDR